MGVAVAIVIFSKDQAQSAREQTYETRREVDIAAVDAKLMSREKHWKRHSQNAPSK
jgi:hypothetical protein